MLGCVTNRAGLPVEDGTVRTNANRCIASTPMVQKMLGYYLKHGILITGMNLDSQENFFINFISYNNKSPS